MTEVPLDHPCRSQGKRPKTDRARAPDNARLQQPEHCHVSWRIPQSLWRCHYVYGVHGLRVGRSYSVTISDPNVQ